MIEQIGIVATGVVAVWLSQDASEQRRRWACLFGMAGQPFWIYAALKTAQWGMFAVTLLYTWGWARGVWVSWIRKTPDGAPGGEPANPGFPSESP